MLTSGNVTFKRCFFLASSMYFFGDHAKGLQGEGGGGTPLFSYISHTGYVLPYQVGFLRRIGLKTGIHFAHFGLESGAVFEGTTECMNVLLPFQSNG